MHALLAVLTDQSMLKSCFPLRKENMSNGCEFDLSFPCSEKGITIKLSHQRFHMIKYVISQSYVNYHNVRAFYYKYLQQTLTIKLFTVDP